MTDRSANRASNYERIAAFLASIGLPLAEGEIPATALLPGVAIVFGGLVVDRDRLIWPGDLLHEAGHIAVIPAALRPTLGGTLADNPEVPYAGEPEATAWAWAALIAIGLEPEVLFHEGGYQGRSPGLAFTFSIGGYPGAAGLIAAGLALSGPEAASQGLLPYPHMVRWLRE